MARSLLGSLVNGTRQMLTAQLFIAVAAVALGGWTLTVTTDLVRERDRLKDRVIQLEQAMASSGTVVPATPVLVDQPAVSSDASSYPGEVWLRGATALRNGVIEVSNAADAVRPASAPDAAHPDQPSFSRVLTGLFAPPPPLHVVVLHVRDPNDVNAARQVGADLLRIARVRVLIDVMTPRDPRPVGYDYFDGRQSGGAATLVGQFNDIARRHEIAPWSAQLRGTAMPAQGEYTTDRIDLLLPALPAPPPPPIAATPSTTAPAVAGGPPGTPAPN